MAHFRSCGWSGEARKNLEKIIGPLKWDLIEAFGFKGCPEEEELKKGEGFGGRFDELMKKEE